jgi:hypothetical protein
MRKQFVADFFGEHLGGLLVEGVGNFGVKKREVEYDNALGGFHAVFSGGVAAGLPVDDFEQLLARPYGFRWA